jgi:ppGpp synthetase/RelA/SpoT-type nucleotidyltranferase
MMQMMKEEWNTWWNKFLQSNHLQDKVRELDEVDRLDGMEPLTEKICYEVYHNYDDIAAGREGIKQELLNSLGQLEQVHLESGRVKKKDSLIEKIIRKRYEYIGSRTSGYAHINGNNYADIITDLVGIRLIVNYRGKWQEIHQQILTDFPLKELSLYGGVEHLPHIKDEAFLAEIPTVYYAQGDSIEQYLSQNLKVKEHTQGYRSIHYVISYKECYVELQVRTIYDEAWSDCDHCCVYKHEAQPNNRALRKLSHILCEITNVANDIGENMHDAFNDERFSDADGDIWKASEADIQFMKDMLKKLKDAENELEEFTKKLKI